MRWAGALAAATSAAATAMSLGVVAFAQASAPSVDLAWSAPPECPSREVVLAEVSSLLAGSGASAHPVSATATVERERDGGRWRVALSIRSDQGAGVRALDADSCAALGSAVALIVALAVDPTRRAAASAAAGAGAGASASAAASAGASADAGASASADAGASADASADASASGDAGAAELRDDAADRGEDDDGVRLAVGASGAADFGVLPSTAVGGVVAVAGLYRRARVEVRGRTYASQHAVDPARPAQGVDLGYLGLDARACLAILTAGGAARDGIGVGPCLGIDLSRISGSGVGGTKTFSGDGSWSAVEASLLGSWALASAFALRVGVDLLVPTSRPGFVVLAPDGSTAETLHRPAPIGGRFDLGGELRFW